MPRSPDDIVRAIRDSFPPYPVPPYPPEMGIDPMGVDEYARFEDVPWDEVELEHLDMLGGYDISPCIGFSLHRSPHMWNYHFPAFLVGSLARSEEFEITPQIFWRLREIELPDVLGVQDSRLPWWAGSTHFGNYSSAQCDCVIRFLRFHRDESPDGRALESLDIYEWEEEDTTVLELWESRVKINHGDD